jgi:GNAT superfamily N-acetyltransferase
MFVSVVPLVDFEGAVRDPRFQKMLESHAGEIDAAGLGVKIDYEPYIALARAGRIVAVAAFDDEFEPVGYWGFDCYPNALNGGLEASELAFYVRPDCRGAGVARQMYEVAADMMRAKGVRIVLVTSRDCVPAGRALVQSLGFSKYAECYEMKL